MAPPGDLYVVVHVAPHPVFGRSNRNLTVTVPVTFPEAALGTTITVPTLDGKVTLKVPAGTQSGRVLRVRGRGVPSGSGRNGGKPGDLMVKIDVLVPTELSEEQRAAVESLAAVTEAAPRAAVES
jgi:molecular chaperone DnaJ